MEFQSLKQREQIKSYYQSIDNNDQKNKKSEIKQTPIYPTSERKNLSEQYDEKNQKWFQHFC